MVGGGILAAEVAFFHVFLGVIPGAAGVGQEDSQYETGTQAAGQQADDTRRPQNDTHQHRHDDRQQGREDHLVLGSLGGNAHAGGVVRALLAFEDARNLAELAADLHHHLLGGAAHGVHRETAEQEGHHGADKHAHQHHRVHEGDVVVIHDIHNGGRNRIHGTVADGEHMLPDMTQADLDLFDVGCQQGQGGEGGAADGESFARSGRGVAQGIQDVGLLADGRIQLGHLRIAAGVIGDGAVSVRGQGDAQGREHTYGGDGNAVQAMAQGIHAEAEARGEAVSQQDGHADGHHRNGRGDHAQAHAVDDDGGGTGLGTLGQFLRRLIGMGGVIFGHLADDHARQQAAHHAQGQHPPVREAQQPEDAEGEDSDENGRQVGTAAQRAQQVLQGGAFLRAHHVDAQDGKHHADGGDGHRGQDGAQLHRGAVGKEGRCTQRHGGEDGAAVALVQVGAHAGHVTYVVAHVVGDGGGVAGVVLRDVLLDLAHDVGAYVGRLGIDAAAHTGEERLRGSTHAEGEHGGGDHHQRLGLGGLMHEGVQHQPPDGDVQQAQAYHGEAHHGAAAESDLKAGVEAAHGGVGRTGTGIGGGFHAHEAGQAAEEAAGEEGERNPGILHAESVGQNGEQRGQHGKDNDDDPVLLLEVGHGAFAHVLGDFFHGNGSFALFHHLTEEYPGEKERQHRC